MVKNIHQRMDELDEELLSLDATENIKIFENLTRYDELWRLVSEDYGCR